MNKKKIECLIKLLDDDSQQSASMVMAELLREDPEDLGGLLSGLQESDNSKLRKRIHQIQSILTTRRHRKDLTMNLQSDKIELVKSLMELHLQWYDNDSEENLFQLWKELSAGMKKYHPSSLEKLAYFMQKCGFAVSLRDDIEADYYCVGIVLDELVGADFIICAIAQALAANWNIDLSIVQLIGEFALMDSKGKILSPKNDWRIVSGEKKCAFRVWDSSMILRLATSMLFLCSISTDSFRYINTIGTCIAKSIGKGDMECLPYPYNSCDDKLSQS